MSILRFAHQFFHFNQAAWENVTRKFSSEEQLARSLFSENLLPRRVLKQIEPRGYAEAMRVYGQIEERESALGLRAISYSNSAYPESILLHIPPERRPALIYLRGREIPPEAALVAIVGTRRPSSCGQEAAHSFSSYLNALGVRTISGLARGIDTIAHEQSLSSGTIAVLGGEIGSVYPEENQNLAERILQHGGTLLSPFPLDQVPLPQNFPERNELIAALAAGTVVIEGAERSGAAITGRHALSMGKTVCALTQDFRSDFGRGAIRLQQEGAVLVTREEEAVEALFRRFGGFAGPLPLAKPIRKNRRFSFTEFQRASGRSVPEALALLEEGLLQGKIVRQGSHYRLS